MILLLVEHRGGMKERQTHILLAACLSFTLAHLHAPNTHTQQDMYICIAVYLCVSFYVVLIFSLLLLPTKLTVLLDLSTQH